MYKPHTIEQYKVYRFLEENFALEHFLLAPLSRFGLMLEDKTGEKIAFAFLNDCAGNTRTSSSRSGNGNRFSKTIPQPYAPPSHP